MDFDTLIMSHLGWLRGLSRWYFRNSIEDAEDLLGDTVYKLLRCRETFRPDAPFKPFAKAIMLNTYIKFYNHRRCLMRCDLADVPEFLASDSASSLAEVRSIQSVFRECAQKSVCMECVALYAEGYTYEEIAASLRISIGTVKSRISTGRRLLKTALET